MKHIVIIHTVRGRSYARRIASSINWISNKRGPSVTTHLVPAIGTQIEAVLETLPVHNTVIHARAANPHARFMDVLELAELDGWVVINCTDTLRVTSDKGLCVDLLRSGGFPQPHTWVVDGGSLPTEFLTEVDRAGITGEDLIVKPEVSTGQGRFVTKVPYEEFCDGTWTRHISGGRVVIQEVVDYRAIYRVICIGERALPFAFVDKPEYHPEEWKVSVCLNKKQTFVPNPRHELLDLAEQAQIYIGGEINFIDIFETGDENDPEFVISEINTACNLRIHEELAKTWGHPDCNIHYKIAKYLVNR